MRSPGCRPRTRQGRRRAPRHADARAREVRVEAEAGLHDGARGRVLRVAREQVEDVVAAAVAGLDDQAQVRRQRAVVGRARLLVVLVRARQVVGQLARARRRLALVVRLALDLDLLGEGAGFVRGQDGADE